MLNDQIHLKSNGVVFKEVAISFLLSVNYAAVFSNAAVLYELNVLTSI